MKDYLIKMTQSAIGYYKGTIKIEANSKKEAEEIIKNMTQYELDLNADWEMGNEFNTEGSITIENIEEI